MPNAGTITHYDLFAGIGGFSLALEEIFSHDHDIKHIFCEWEQFPTAVLKKHWPDAEFFGDIADLVSHTRGQGNHSDGWSIVTGGFPCQPFSHAGRRRGTADDRYQWPNMFEVIRNVKPDWVIAENVRGLVTWNDGLVLEQVCSDLESEGYEVQPLVIPAVAVNAPHRRDRVWIIAHNDSNAASQRRNDGGHTQPERHILLDEGIAEKDKPQGNGWLSRDSATSQTNANTGRQYGGSGRGREVRPTQQKSSRQERQHPDWQRDWQEVAFATCHDGMDDGLSRIVDGVPHSRARWRAGSLKAYGNAIVPQVAIEIMRAIRTAHERSHTLEAPQQESGL